MLRHCFLVSSLLVALFPPSIQYNLDILDTQIFTPSQANDPNQLFGYSVSSSQKYPHSFLVGAPKNHNGRIYNCSLPQKQCHPVDYTFATKREEINKRNEMFGASIVQLDDGKIITCSSSYKDTEIIYQRPYKEKGKYASGECYMGEQTHLKKLDLGKDVLPMYDKMYNSACGQHGTSINKHNNDVVFGAPGYYNWKGNIIMQRFDNSAFKLCQFSKSAVDSDEYSYYGYSVTTLRIGSETHVAMGGPRDSLYGGVIIWWLHGCSIYQKRKIQSSNFAAYFGSSLARIDVEGDGNDELVVGIPFYNQSIGDEGKVEIFKLHNDKWEKVFELNGQIPFSRFGSVVFSPGDVDQDGHEDLSVSAPEEDGGKVYLYYGGLKGFNEPKVQKISAGKVFSFDAFIRPDGYPNIFFGQGEENRVTLFKARPVHEIKVKIDFKDNFIYWNPVSCDQNQTSANKTLSLIVEYVVPPEEKEKNAERNRIKNMRYEIVPNKRGYIQKKDRSHGNMKAMNENFEGTLDFETSDSILHVFDLVFPFKKIPENLDKPIKISFFLHESDAASGPMLTPTITKQYNYKLTFQRRKTSSRDTLIKMVLLEEKIPYDIGFQGRSIVKGLLTNEGETAFDTTITLNHPSWATLKSVSTNMSCFKIDCKRTWGTKSGYVVEKCNCPEALTESTLEIYFHFEHSVVDDKQVNAYDVIYGTSKAVFEPHFNSTLTAFNASLDSSLLHKVPIGYSFSTNHFYDIRNSLTHPQFEIEVYEPFSAFNIDLCCLETEISVVFKKGKSGEIIQPVHTFTNNSESLSQYLESSLLENSSIKLSSLGKDFSRFSIPYLHHDQSIDVTIKNNISGELLGKLQKFENFIYYTNLFLTPAVVKTSKENFLSGSYKKESLFFEIVSQSSGSIPPAPTPYWLIILCILIGLVVVLILGLILKKLGFFKRKKHEMLIEKRRESKRLSQKAVKDFIEECKEETD